MKVRGSKIIAEKNANSDFTCIYRNDEEAINRILSCHANIFSVFHITALTVDFI